MTLASTAIGIAISNTGSASSVAQTMSPPPPSLSVNPTIYVSEPTDVIGAGRVALRLFTSTAAQSMSMCDVAYPGGFPSVITKFADVALGIQPIVLMPLLYLPFFNEPRGLSNPIASGSLASGFLFLDNTGSSAEPAGDHLMELYELPPTTQGIFRPGALLTYYQNKLDERAYTLQEDRVLIFPVARNPGSGFGFSSREIDTESNGSLNLSWMRARAGGTLGAFLANLGATLVGSIGGNKIVEKLYDGTINYAEFNGPFLNENVGLHNQSNATYYYSDNIQEYTSIYFAFVNAKWWYAKDDAQRRAFHIERRAQMEQGYQEALAENERILSILPSRGLTVRTFSNSTLDAMRTQWDIFVALKTTPTLSSYDAEWTEVYNIIYAVI